VGLGIFQQLYQHEAQPYQISSCANVKVVSLWTAVQCMVPNVKTLRLLGCDDLFGRYRVHLHVRWPWYVMAPFTVFHFYENIYTECVSLCGWLQGTFQFFGRWIGKTACLVFGWIWRYQCFRRTRCLHLQLLPSVYGMLTFVICHHFDCKSCFIREILVCKN
jgi:hypothetical protein